MTHPTSRPAIGTARQLDEAATRTEQAFYDRASREIAAAHAHAASPDFLTSISEAAALLRSNTTPAALGVHRAALDYLHTHALDLHTQHQANLSNEVQA